MEKERKHSHNYKGGSIASNGYKLIFVGKDHHLADVRGYAYEHRLVAEKKIGRKLRKGEQIHHIDHNKLNNHPDNLEVAKSFRHHKFLHRKANSNNRHPDEENVLVECACGCGEKFWKYDSSNRPRKYIPGHNVENSELPNLLMEYLEDGVKTINEIASKFPKWKRESIQSILTRLTKLDSISRIKIGVYGKSGTPVFRRENPIIKCACGCGQSFTQYDSHWRERKYISGHNRTKNG